VNLSCQLLCIATEPQAKQCSRAGLPISNFSCLEARGSKARAAASRFCRDLPGMASQRYRLGQASRDPTSGSGRFGVGSRKGLTQPTSAQWLATVHSRSSIDLINDRLLVHFLIYLPITRTSPGFTDFNSRNNTGTSGLRSPSLLELARKTMSANGRPAIFCCNGNDLSTVTRTSNLPVMASSSAPSASAAQPR